MTLDIHNKTFGELQVLDKSGKVDGHRRSFWDCRCSCGVLVNVRIDRLMSGKTKSCGHLLSNYMKGREISPTKSELGLVYSTYKQSAKRGGRCFILDFGTFSRLVMQPCYYCNSAPATKVRTRSGSIVFYNGLDRVDNSRGYTPENVVPCCDICNMGKRTKEFSVFTDWISRLSGFSLRGLISG